MGMVYKILYQLLSAMSFFVMLVVDTMFWYAYKKDQKSVSKVTDPILLMPATILAAKIRKRELRAEDVMASYISRAKEVNLIVNAIVGEQYDKALRTAQNLDRTLNSMTPEEIESHPEYSLKTKPFLGVPLSVKESLFWTGMANTVGIVARKPIRSTKDARVLSQLKEAGAIPFIQTNLSELCMWYESSNYVYGCTNNAYNSSRMVGGSSGGEGCAISAGASVLGIGSDIGGSIRLPCFFNGIFGHKPSVDIVDNRGKYPSTNNIPMLATGPMCRYASDLIPALKVMAQPGAEAKLKLDVKVDIAKLKVISVPDDSGGLMTSKVNPQLQAVQKKVAAYLQGKGATVSEQRVDEFCLAEDMWTYMMKQKSDDAPSFSVLMSGSEDGGPVNCFKEFFLSAIRKSQHTFPAIMYGILNDLASKNKGSGNTKVKDALENLKAKMLRLLGDDGVMLYPSYPKIAPYHSQPFFTPFSFAYTALFNALGFPVTQCPLGLSKEGLPLGIQVVATPFNDHLSLAVAQLLEEGFGGWVSPGSK